MNLLFARHAQSAGNLERRWQGRAEFDLTAEGRAEAAMLRDRFREESFTPTHVYSSPQLRAAETVKVVAEDWTVPIVYWDDLREHDIGVFSGLTWAEIAEAYPEMAKSFEESRNLGLVEGAESLDEKRCRARRVVDAVIERHGNDDSLLFLTHGGILLDILAALLGTDRTWGLQVPNTGLFGFSLDRDRWSQDGPGLSNTTLWRITHFNDASHLGPPVR